MTDHRCRSNDRCAARTDDGPALTAAPSTICDGCVTRLQQQLDQLPAIRDLLRGFIGISPVTSHGSKVNASRTPSAPLNVNALDLRDEIGDVMDRVGNTRIADLITRGPENHVVWRGGRRIEVDIDGVDLALMVAAVWAKGDRVIGLSEPKWVRRLAPCPRCAIAALGSLAGSDTISCSSCGYVFPRHEYEVLCVNLGKGK